MKLMMLYNTGLVLLVIGAMMNFVVIGVNNGYMPVITNYEVDLKVGHHHYVEDCNNIKMCHLADKYKFRNYYYSKGDITIYLGLKYILFTIIMCLIPKTIKQRYKESA